MTRDTTNAIRNNQNSTCAIPAAVPAMPVKPKIAAMIATMKKPIAQPSIEASNGWIGQPSAVQTACRCCGAATCFLSTTRRLLREQILRRRRGLWHRRFRVAVFFLRVPLVRIGVPVEGRLAVRRHQAEEAQVVLGDFAQRPEPFQEAREMRHALGMRANARRHRIEETAALHARNAFWHERQRAGDANVHDSSPLLFTAEAERSERPTGWLAQISASRARRVGDVLSRNDGAVQTLPCMTI